MIDRIFFRHIVYRVMEATVSASAYAVSTDDVPGEIATRLLGELLLAVNQLEAKIGPGMPAAPGELSVSPIGRAVRARRAQLGISQAELAKASKVAPTSIASLERGYTKTPRLTQLKRLEAGLGLQPGELMNLAGKMAEP